MATKRRGRFWRFAFAGIFFQGGNAGVEPGTVIAALVHGLTGSITAVGVAAAITRYGWMFPQIFVAHHAQGRARRMGFYVVGAFGRAVCLALIAVALAAGADMKPALIAAAFFVLWTAYGFISGIVAVPYNDIVARSIPSARRSRMLAVRFFGGGLLALGVAAAVHELLGRFAFHTGYAIVLALSAALMIVSACCFVSAGEPPAPPPAARLRFTEFLSAGIVVLREDRRFRSFLYVQWLAGAVSMALPFYILQAAPEGEAVSYVAVLLGAQTAGALASNPLWGWWGDRRGKLSLLRLVSRLNAVAPAATLLWIGLDGIGEGWRLAWFGAVFFILGAVGNGRTIAYLGYLMEISPDDRRPAYSGYFNALAAPAALLPILGAAIVEAAGFAAVFAAGLAAAGFQLAALRRLAAPGSETAP